MENEVKAPLEPWWVANDRRKVAHMLSVIEGKGDTELVRYMGDMRPEPCALVREKAAKLSARIEADIAQFNEVGGDYDRM